MGRGDTVTPNIDDSPKGVKEDDKARGRKDVLE
jgi:hypothetical protein